MNRSLAASLDSAERQLEEILTGGGCISLRDLAVDGSDLLALGITPGPEVGRILNTLLEEATDELLPNERESLLRRAAEIKGGLKE